MNKPRKLIDIVIPFNNEYLNLQILLPKVLKIIKKIKYLRFRIILINDGSTDEGPKYVIRFKKKYKNIFILNNDKNKGQTVSYKNYFNKFKSQYFIRMDADNQDDPINLIKISNYILKDYDFVLTERKLRKHSTYMILLTFLYNKLIALLVRKKLNNYSSSLACFKRKYIPKRNLKYNDHRYFPIISLDNGAKKVTVFSVIHKKRIHGITKYNMFKKIFFALPEFLFFYYRLKMGIFKR